MYGTADAVRAWTTLPMTVSAPSPEAIQFPEELVLNSRVVKVRMALPDSCPGDRSDGVDHLAGDQNPARTTEPAVNLGLNSGRFRRRVSHGVTITRSPRSREGRGGRGESVASGVFAEPESGDIGNLGRMFRPTGTTQPTIH